MVHENAYVFYMVAFVLVTTLNSCKVDDDPVTPPQCGDAVTYAGKTYNTVKIGEQCWFKENLDVGTIVDGLNNQMNDSTIEKYCYRNDSTNCITYGALYQWNEAMQYATSAGARGICPAGWHIPTYSEFLSLKATVNNDCNALKSVGQGTGSAAGTNTSGFSGMFSGSRESNGAFSGLGYSAFFWSSTENGATFAGTPDLFCSDNPVYAYGNKEIGLSVRCLKDSTN